MYALAYMLFAPVFGAISDRFGRKNMILLGMFVLALGTALTAFASSLMELLIFRVITGLGAGILEPAVFSLVGDRFPYEKRGQAMGIVTGSLTMSTLVGVPLGSFMADLISWRWSFWSISFFCLFTFILLITGIQRDHGKRTESPILQGIFKPFHMAIFDIPVLFSLLATFLWFGGLQGMFANTGVFYHTRFQLSVSEVGVILSLAGLGSVVGSFVGGKWSDRYGKKKMIGFSSVCAAASLFSLSVIPTKEVVVAVIIHICWATAFGFGHAALTALISELNPAARGMVLSLNSSAMYAGMTVATALSSALLYEFGFWGVGSMCSLATFLVYPLLLFLSVRGQKAKQHKIFTNQKSPVSNHDCWTSG
ncbi:MFS transporter [Paenactinomyces guangxiensis]|uniref:MFS transporter n=1 Tax=Paenactinomyces guangxiensis TaxID=1490290 RepID=A0A7W1WUW5_9BACL|nr:MFS transporter [Paenactinomyces guangxiensis]MBH8593676.1 MFS transporter [Paenactinomyces guangxiensis]